MLRKFFLLIALAIWMPAVTFADYNNPKSFKDCHVKTSPAYPFKAAMAAKREEWRQCYAKLSREFARPNSTARIGQYDQSCLGKPNSGTCSEIVAANCEILKTAEALEEQCKSKLQQSQLKERQNRARLEAEQANDTERAAQQRRQQAEFMRQSGLRSLPGVGPKIDSEISRAQGIVSAPIGGVQNALLGLGRTDMLGLPRLAPRTSLANHLVLGELNAAGARLYQGIATESMSLLEGALAEMNGNSSAARYSPSVQSYSANNPRPTNVQREALVEQLMEIQDHAIRVVGEEYVLPLGGESAVSGAYAQLADILVVARNSGLIDGGFSDFNYESLRDSLELDKRSQDETISTSKAAPSVILPRENLTDRRAAILRAIQQNLRKQLEVENVTNSRKLPNRDLVNQCLQFGPPFEGTGNIQMNNSCNMELDCHTHNHPNLFRIRPGIETWLIRPHDYRISDIFCEPA